MPRNRIGQMISFGTEVDEDRRIRKWIWIDVKVGDTVMKIAGRRGHPEDARRIADENGIGSVRKVLRHKPFRRRRDLRRIKVPGEAALALGFNVLAGDEPPRIVDGYAKIGVLDRPERVGLTTFEGYNPIVMEVPIRFEAKAGITPAQVERDIALLERFAGRGDFAGAGVGPPPVIRVSTTDANGAIVALIPPNYQWSRQNPSAPLWRVVNPIEWDNTAGSGVLRNNRGERVRQLAVVRLQQHTRIKLQTRSAARRSRRGRR